MNNQKLISPVSSVNFAYLLHEARAALAETMKQIERSKAFAETSRLLEEASELRKKIKFLKSSPYAK